MKLYFTRFLILVFFVGTCTLTFAQYKVNFIEGNVTFMKPLGFFSKNIPEAKLGFEFGYLRQLKVDQPLFWGLSCYYNDLGSNGAVVQEVIEFNVFDVNYTTTSNLLGFNGKLRFYPAIYFRKFEFYIEAQLGYKWLFTNTTRTIADDSDSSDLNTEKGALSLTYGAAAGFNLPVKNDWFINFRINYLPGLSVPYYILNNQNIINYSTLDGFDLKRSVTDIFRMDFGITYKF